MNIFLLTAILTYLIIPGAYAPVSVDDLNAKLKGELATAGYAADTSFQELFGALSPTGLKDPKEFFHNAWQEQITAASNLKAPLTAYALYALDAILSYLDIAELMGKDLLKLYNGNMEQLQPHSNLDITHVHEVCRNRCVLRLEHFDQYWGVAGKTMLELEKWAVIPSSMHVTAVSRYPPSEAANGKPYQQLYMLPYDSILIQVGGSMTLTISHVPVQFYPTPEESARWNQNPDPSFLEHESTYEVVLQANQAIYVPAGFVVRITVPPTHSSATLEIAVETHKISWASLIQSHAQAYIEDTDGVMFRQAIKRYEVSDGDYILGKFFLDLAKRIDVYEYFKNLQKFVTDPSRRPASIQIAEVQPVSGMMWDLFAAAPLSSLSLDMEFLPRPNVVIEIHGENEAGEFSLSWVMPGMKNAKKLSFPDARTGLVFQWVVERDTPFTPAEIPQDAPDAIKLKFVLNLMQQGLVTLVQPGVPQVSKTLGDVLSSPRTQLSEALARGATMTAEELRAAFPSARPAPAAGMAMDANLNNLAGGVSGVAPGRNIHKLREEVENIGAALQDIASAASATATADNSRTTANAADTGNGSNPPPPPARNVHDIAQSMNKKMHKDAQA